MKSVAFCTLGCKVNQYETDAMEEIFQKGGYEIRDFHEKADVYVINTCTVTNMADRKSRQMLHRARKKNPQAVIVAAGCYVQTAREAAEADASIDLIIGNNCKGQILSMVETFMEGRTASEESDEKQVGWLDMNQNCDYESLSITKVSEHTRAYIKIQDGCNQFCSYCIIPYARGRIRSREPEEILSEVSILAASGYREIVLTGIHISSYGKDFGREDALISLVEKLASIEGVDRIRFGSLEPGIITEDFVQRLAAIKQICPHFHLSLQSGCDKTLAAMNRKYTVDDYRKACGILRKYYDRPAVTTDIIVGFPGETDGDFEQSVRFVKEIGFSDIHVFKYSKRDGTRAAQMECSVPESVKHDRSSRLIDAGREMTEIYNRSFIGQKQLCLVEERITAGDREYFTGHNERYIKLIFDAYGISEDMQNELVEVVPSEIFDDGMLHCERI